jgi:hypothetical protein
MFHALANFYEGVDFTGKLQKIGRQQLPIFFREFGCAARTCRQIITPEALI